MLKQLGMIVLLLSCSVASEQVPTFSIGETREQLQKKFGGTNRYYVPQAGSYANGEIEYRAALKVYGFVEDVYTRKTKSNEYELHFKWAYDETSSRLHPQARVERVTADFDKATSLVAALADFPEAKELCREGCHVWGVNYRAKPQLVLFPKSQTPEEVTIAQGSASGWKADQSPSQYHWYLSVKGSLSSLSRDGSNRSTRETYEILLDKIDTIEFSAFDPEFEKKMSSPRSLPGNQIVEFSDWTPSRVP